jgi:hypothetical protein
MSAKIETPGQEGKRPKEKARIYFDGEAFRARCPDGRYVSNLGICDSCPQQCFSRNKEEMIEKAREEFYGRGG